MDVRQRLPIIDCRHQHCEDTTRMTRQPRHHHCRDKGETRAGIDNMMGQERCDDTDGKLRSGERRIENGNIIITFQRVIIVHDHAMVGCPCLKYSQL